jgi:uncharacterized protein YcbK (DUF882 family)
MPSGSNVYGTKLHELSIINYQLSIRKMNLSPHFTLKEMLRSEVAKKRKIENRINDEEVDNLVRLCTKVLEPLREHFGVPIKINSGFRCRDLNDAVKGADNSYHMKGRAVDIPMHPGWLAYIRDHLPHTELINEGTWIHVAL